MHDLLRALQRELSQHSSTSARLTVLLLCYCFDITLYPCCCCRLPLYTRANYGLGSSLVMGLVHTTVFHFGFMLKLALRVSASNPAFILLSMAAFAQEAVGLR
jgi:hypothetical protein